MDFFIDENSKFYIWGAYWQGEELYQQYKDKLNIVGFLDLGPKVYGRFFASLPVFHPDVLKEKNSENTKVIVAYHSPLVLKDTLEGYGFLEHEGWFNQKDFALLYPFATTGVLRVNHLFLSLKGEDGFLPPETLWAECDLCFKQIDQIEYFGFLEEDWMRYPWLKKFLEGFSQRGYREKVIFLFCYGDKDSVLTEEQLTLLAKHSITMRISNYKQEGCDTASVLPLIEVLQKHVVDYYLMFPYTECEFTKNISWEYDYPDKIKRGKRNQYFFSTCDGDIRFILKNNGVYLQKSLDLCKAEMEWEKLDFLFLSQQKQDFFSFLLQEGSGKTREMKLSYLGCGLGNQLFLYAFKRFIEIKTGETLIFDDIFYFTRKEHNGSELRKIFPKAKVNFLSDHVQDYIYKQMALIEKKFNMLCWLLMNQNEKTFFCCEEYYQFGEIYNDYPKSGKKYPCFNFYPEIQEEKASLLYYSGFWFHGGWMSAEGVFPLVKEELTFPPITEGKNLGFLKQIKETESISLHIRRGDTIGGTWPRKFLGDDDYYSQAIRLYRKKINNPTFFVFSDDIPWCKENQVSLGFLPSDQVVFMEGNSVENEHYRDIQLMAECQHMIITNSTFSFFASLLNENKSYIKPFGVYEKLKDVVEIEPLPNGIWKNSEFPM